MHKEDIVIVSMARTAFGAFQGALSDVPAVELGGEAIAAAMKKISLSPEEVTQVIMGNVLSAGVGQSPARQAALHAGLGPNTSTFTLNKVCGSGMKSIALGWQALLCDESQKALVVGGMENMSQAPHLLKNSRKGFKLGDASLVDSMVHDGLTNPYDGRHMGQCAEACASEKHISREEQDAYAIESFKRAQKAIKESCLDEQIVPVNVKVRRDVIEVKEDENPFKANFEKMPTLKPCFEKEGTITAANASSINDGACALILMRRKDAEAKGLKPLARIISVAEHAEEPVWFTLAPIGAMEKALSQAGWNLADVDLFEINEAFAVVPLAAQKMLNIPKDKLNVWGGAIALGHPIGASGTRIMMQLIGALKKLHKKRGLASICIGGGEAMAICIEREEVA